MTDPVREYLSSQRCAKHVVRGGLEYLVSSWESTVRDVTRGRYEEFDEDEYLNDVDARAILAGVSESVPEECVAPFRGRIETSDAAFLRASVPTQACIWGDPNAEARGWTRDRDWWYFRRPIRGSLNFT